jgi:hypothetical protein
MELRPQAGWALAPHSVTGAFVGANAAYRVGPHWVLGLDGALYSPFNGSAGATPSYPVTETTWSAGVDVAYIPWPRSSPGELEWYALLGAGLVATHPVAVVDPVNRHFDDSSLAELAAGVGLRLYLDPTFALTLEVRDRAYSDRYENPSVRAGTTRAPPDDPNNPRNPATWYSPDASFTQCFELRLGISFFFGE